METEAFVMLDEQGTPLLPTVAESLERAKILWRAVYGPLGTAVKPPEVPQPWAKIKIMVIESTLEDKEQWV